MKWLKRILLCIATLLTALAVLAAYGFWKSGQRPEWYKPLTLSNEQIGESQQQAMKQMHDLQEMADKTKGKGVVVSSEADRIILKLNDQELNALFLSSVGPDRERIEKFCHDPQVHIENGQVILAATFTMKGTSRVLSAHFEPYVNEQGKLDMNLTSVQAGQLRIPQVLLSTLINSWEQKLDRAMVTWRDEAAINGQSGCNVWAMDAAIGQMILGALRHQVVPAVLFPPDVDPVKLVAIEIDNSTMSLQVQPMSAEQRSQALDELRQSPAQTNSTP